VYEQHGLLEVLDSNGRRDLLAHARIVRARKGQVLLARGEPPGDVFIIQEGRLRVVLYAADGTEVSLRELHEGELFGELAAIDGAARSAGVIAVSNARLLAIRLEAFRQIINNHSEAANWLIYRLTLQIRGLTDRVFELSALSVRARLHCELIRLASTRAREIETAPTHAELANRIGTHREAVTRELKVLADLKIIRSGRRRLEIVDIAGLEKLVSANLRVSVGEGRWW
jgi:CRP/FNR family transcriptional regulator, cyclic AMP receptor protein